jgi:hypothetical protein
MRALADNEKRTVRLAAIGIGIYLALFFGLRAWNYAEARRADYQRLTDNALSLRREIERYNDKALIVEKLMKEFNLDPAKLSRVSVVAGASAAIQKAGTSGQVAFGPIRETPGQSSGKELSAIQIEGTGPVQAVLGLLHRLTGTGYPAVIDSVQLTPEKTKPGTLKLNMTIIILDFDQWKKAEAPNA